LEDVGLTPVGDLKLVAAETGRIAVLVRTFVAIWEPDIDPKSLCPHAFVDVKVGVELIIGLLRIKAKRLKLALGH
jgi:hypothetical protein